MISFRSLARPILVLGGVLLAGAPCAPCAPGAPGYSRAAGADVDFGADVRPILAKHCYLCHGPDVSTRKAGLRLDDRANATKARRDAPPIVPGDARASGLLHRITATNDDRMPPPERTALTPAEIDVLRRWIDEGATYTAHWAWTPVSAAPPPVVADDTWGAHPIDRFLRAALDAQGLTPAPPADRAVLIRRLSFDLTGLPPTPDEVAAFIADEAPGAWERLVDRLLASPRYGERWGRHWLDLMRYAETYGHEFDYPIRHAWQYRDYVIRALNDDVPYDRFVTEHLAGDLLATPRRHPTEGYDESIIGTGFWFLSQGTHAPVDVRQDEAERIDNQIDVLGKAFLGVTVSCARCHDHKFDPVSTRDFYALAGFLQSSRRQEAYLDPKGRIADAAERLDRTLARAARRGDALTIDVDDAAYAASAATIVRAAEAFVAQATEAVEKDEPDKPKIDAAIAAARTAADTQIETALDEAAEDGGLNRDHLAHWVGAVRTRLPRDHPARALQEGLLAVPPADAASPPADDGPSPWSLERATIFETFDDSLAGWFETGFAFGGRPTRTGDMTTRDGVAALLPPGVAHSGRLGPRLQGTIRSRTFEIDFDRILYRVAGRGARIRLIIDGYVLDEYNALLFEGMKIDVNSGADGWVTHQQDVHRYRGHRAHIEIVDDGDGFVAVDEIWFADADTPAAKPSPEPAWAPAPGVDPAQRVALAAAAAIDRLRAGRADRPRIALLNWLLERGVIAAPAPEIVAAAVDIDATLPRPMRVVAIADGTPEDEHVFIRGNHRAAGDVAPRAFIAAFGGPQPPVTEGSGRLELARRLLDARNPLPARVMVNRVWLHLFGEGIVPTPDDFGGLGQPPSHPALLDWLATWFRHEAGWSTKRLIRLVVTSRAYRMSSVAADPAAAERDPGNRLLHRAHVRRLDAESIRDAVLAVSGRLDERMYGAPVDVHLTPFLTGRGRPGRSGPLDGDGRRSIYLAVRRNFRTPMMSVFDAPLPAQTIGRRNRSNVPAQALMMMNDPFVVEQSATWARALLADDTLDAAGRVDRMYRQAYARPATASEIELALAFVWAQAHEHDGQVGDAWAAHEPAWADLAHVVLNTKEFLFSR